MNDLLRQNITPGLTRNSAPLWARGQDAFLVIRGSRVRSQPLTIVCEPRCATKLKFNYLKKSKNNSLTVQIFCNLKNHPTFHSVDRLANLVRGRECCVGLSIL